LIWSRTHPLTLPGMNAKDADRSEVTLRDHVDAVVEVVDSLDPVNRTGRSSTRKCWSTSTMSAAQRCASARSRRPSASRATRSGYPDDRRYDVPATVIACEFPSAMLRQWMEEGHPGAQELAKLRDVEYVDLPSGHWPQFTRPEELGRAILASVDPA